jgi:hypothetical protein
VLHAAAHGPHTRGVDGEHTVVSCSPAGHGGQMLHTRFVVDVHAVVSYSPLPQTAHGEHTRFVVDVHACDS